MAKSKFRRTNIEIEEENLERFRQMFPQPGALKWFINEVFRNFAELHKTEIDEDIRESIQRALGSLT